jgi:hypothetical protein
MRTHSANQLRTVGNIIDPDGVTTRAIGIRMGVEDLTGKRLEQVQRVNSEISSMIVMHAADADTLNDSCYITADGNTYIVDWILDPRAQRPGMWKEVYCHIERGGK